MSLYTFLKKLNNLLHLWCNKLVLLRLQSSCPRSMSIYYGHKLSSLAELADTYNTDKGTQLTDDKKFPWPCHTYTDLYDLLFCGRRQFIRSIFECGIGSTNPKFSDTMTSTGSPGASLRMWSEYFPNAKVYGADIDKSVLFSTDKITTHWVDQLNPLAIQLMWDAFGLEYYDVIIDDGLHRFDAGITLFENSISRLSCTGVYIIEDVTEQDLVKYIKYFEEHQSYLPHFIRMKKQGFKSNQNNLILVTNSEYHTMKK